MNTQEFNLNKEHKDEMCAQIRQFFLEERGEEIGDLAALMVLEFFTAKLGAHFYNLGVQDSYRYISLKLEDLFEIEKK
ncbi:DUF2164 domain-containing protein [Mesobacillus foraminis]|uniref:DUF2164 domain-containing protein n=1 Tax=Mesobacillus foraminis TaxID=279826 RepID=UPI001BE5D737|nr:DUF2164 domain-containing protein [Mesobacillus foraminis]MBT2758538.1 DUF2164 domain-containing protein [Mesobacillus foraminis]